MNFFLLTFLMVIFLVAINAQDDFGECVLKCEDNYAQCTKNSPETECFDTLVSCYTACGFSGLEKIRGPHAKKTDGNLRSN